MVENVVLGAGPVGRAVVAALVECGVAADEIRVVALTVPVAR